MTANRYSITRRNALKKGALATGALVVGGTAATGSATAGIGDGRVLDYHLNNVNYDRDRGEIVAGHVHDASTYDNDGEWINASIDPVVGGPVGNAYSFEETNGDHIAIESPSGLEVEEVTISAWVDPNSSKFEYIFDGPGHNYYLKENDGTETPEFGFFNDNGFNRLVATTALPTGTWSHVAATYDQSEGTMRLYINDDEDARNAASGPIHRYSDGDFVVDSGEARIGRYLGSNQNGAYYFDGNLDEVRVYDRALSRAELTELATMDES